MYDLKKAVKGFITEDDGAETIEYICIIAVVAALIGVVVAIVAILKSKMETAGDTINGIDPTIPSTGGGTTSTPSTP